MTRRRLAGVVALYAATVLATTVVVASVLVAPTARFGPIPILVPSAYLALVGFDWDFDEPRLFLVPFAVCLLVAGTYWTTGQLEPAIRSVDALDAVRVDILQAAAATLAVAAVAAIGVPVAAHRYAWGELRDTAVADGDDVDADAPDRGASDRLEGVPERIAAHAPARLDVATLDDPDPAVYVVDDGRRAVVGFTTAAVAALSEREREAVLAREVTRVVDREALASFYASALAFAVARLVDPVTTRVYEARAGDKVRLPYWFVAPVKVIAALVGLFVGFYVPVWTLADALGVNPLTLVFAYAVGTLAAGFAVTTVARWLARDIATEAVLTADEHGAVLDGTTEPLATALRKLEDAAAISGDDDGLESNDDASGDDGTGHGRHGDTLDAFDGLVHVPTDHVPLQERLDALETVADRLESRRRRSVERSIV